MIFQFENLHVYQEGVAFSHKIYTITKLWPSPYRFSLIDQLQRAALSIPLNIAEGSSRTKKDFQHFLTIARGSCYECVPLIQIAFEEKLITQTEFEQLRFMIVSIAKMLTALRAKI
jgi:four helix bundle protein